MRLQPGLLLLALCASSARIVAQAGDAEPNDYPDTIQRDPPMIGMFPSSVPDEIARSQGIAPGTGVLVVGVMPGSMAESIGLKPGDVVTSLNGQPVNSYDQIVAARDQKRAGDPAEMEFVHAGERHVATGTLSAWPQDGSTPRMSGDIGGLLRRAAEAAQRRRDADLQRDTDALRDELAALRERLNREDAQRDRDAAFGPWRLAWDSAPLAESASDESPATVVAAAPDEVPANGGHAWSLHWSNAHEPLPHE